VELMGGSIGFETSEGSGSLFRFTVPLKVSAAKFGFEAEKPAGSKTVASYTWKNSPGAVLVVDDFEFNRRVLSMQLEKLGLESETAASGQEAVSMFARKNYALVLMDCRMPGMDGFQAAVAIRRLEAGKSRHTPIIAITAGTSYLEKEKCLDAGMDDYLGKPVLLDALSEALARWLPGATAITSDNIAIDTTAVPKDAITDDAFDAAAADATGTISVIEKILMLAAVQRYASYCLQKRRRPRLTWIPWKN
jgi:CheY-like chemotaxis protein